ncbi:MAG: hypothetical protein LBB84_11340 [Tannerellaceae bacterium]|jgi:hypothetical protein|nr:hypothetical protein [Tannerellaceae bacterium]
MDNLGDLLYIVLLIIAGISWLLGLGKNKKQEQPREILEQPDYEIESEYSNPEEIFPPKPTETKKKEKTFKPTQTYTPLFGEGERTVTTPVVDSFSELSPNDENPGISGDTFQDMEELKKAIIYSEILNRKY